MSAPSVCCLLLTADRQRFTDRAVKCFLSQTYENSWLLIYDTGEVPYQLPMGIDSHRIVQCYVKPHTKRNIGALRNEAIDMAGGAEVIAHWDSDDWSAPHRLEVQLAAMESGPLVTGFHNLLFLNTQMGACFTPMSGKNRCEAWEYDYKVQQVGSMNAKVLGTSLVYRREVWKAMPFNEHKQSGEDTEWTKILTVKQLNGVSMYVESERFYEKPLMIAEVHGSNTSGVYRVFDNHNPVHNPEWHRAPEWDAWCRERLYP